MRGLRGEMGTCGVERSEECGSTRREGEGSWGCGRGGEGRGWGRGGFKGWDGMGWDGMEGGVGEWDEDEGLGEKGDLCILAAWLGRDIDTAGSGRIG